MFDLLRSARWRDVKRKAKNVKDVKEQIAVNEALIAAMDNQHDILQTIDTRVTNVHNDTFGIIVPVIKALAKEPQIMDILMKNLTESDFKKAFGKSKKEVTSLNAGLRENSAKTETKTEGS